MSTKLLSIIGTLTNLLLGLVKLGVGYTVRSMALIADGIHSGMDVISSFVTFLGIRAAEKPVDEKHPYGYYRAESIAGFFVTLLLTLSGIWIIYEAISSILNPGDSTLGIVAIIVAVFSVVINEILSKMEFHFGQKYQSLALVADAEHNRADALSSIGVLVGLVLANYYALADELL
ncbi:MAG: cation diffusion facilitator family transporter, partial [Minisyncoccales bacterium]